MFETAVVRPQAQAADRRVGLLSLSVAAHSLAGIALLTASLNSLKFPIDAPHQMSLWSPMPVIELPIAQGHPNVTKPTQQAARPQQSARVQTAPPDAAPQIIPSDVPRVAVASTSTGDTGTSNTGPGSGEGPIGDVNGVPGGLEIAPPNAHAAPETHVYHSSEVNALPVVITRVSPDYPRLAQMAHRSGWVIVECVIDKSGRTRDAHVVGSSWEVFDKPALDAVSQWTFKPGQMRGEAVDTLFELRVTFTLR
jgi:TonB family protein